MSPQNHLHSRCITLVTCLLVELFSKTHYVRVQLPLNLSPDSQPEPDFALVERTLMDRLNDHPETADLVIEVSDSSLRFDRDPKGALYAQAGIPEYWILNVQTRQVEVYRQPRGDGYASRQTLEVGETVRPLFRPDQEVTVANLF